MDFQLSTSFFFHTQLKTLQKHTLKSMPMSLYVVLLHIYVGMSHISFVESAVPNMLQLHCSNAS